MKYKHWNTLVGLACFAFLITLIWALLFLSAFMVKDLPVTPVDLTTPAK